MIVLRMARDAIPEGYKKRTLYFHNPYVTGRKDKRRRSGAASGDRFGQDEPHRRSGGRRLSGEGIFGGRSRGLLLL